jgi:membrane protease YdiL (CAAX protease family)
MQRQQGMRWLRQHPILCYLVVTYGVTWAAWGSLAAAGHVVTVGFVPTYWLGLLGPLIGAVVTSAIVARGDGVRDLGARMVRGRVGSRWWAIALGLPLGVAFVTYAGAWIVATFGFGFATGRDYGAFNGFPATSPLALWVMLIVVNGFGEETGWRGFLLPHLQRRWSPLTSSLIVGVCWAVWHIPAFFITETYRQMPVAVIPMFFVGLVSGSVFLTWLYNRGGSSILLVAVWHGTYNWLSGSVGARGALAAIETTVVMIVAGVLLVQELRATRREHGGHPARHVMAAR